MEKIIIDGVDVSKCKFFTQEQPHLSITCLDCLSQGNCNNSDCYYKQLQHLKEENEELIERANAYNDMKILANCRLEKLEKVEECINKTCFDYAGIDMVYFKNELLQIIRGEE